MVTKSAKPNRKSIRLKGYAYSQPGAYFITLVTQNRACLFGEVRDCQMHLNPVDEMVEKWCHALPNKFPSISLGAHVTMPDHFHAIIIIASLDVPVGVDPCVDPNQGGHAGPPLHAGSSQRIIPPQPNDVALPSIIQWFKTMTTNEYIRCVKTITWPQFDRRLWQRNYYDHIIRNDQEYQNIMAYIEANPSSWSEDEYFSNPM